MTKGLVLAAVAGMATIALSGGVLYGVIFAGFFRTNIVDLSIMNNAPGIGWIALSHVPFGILLALVVRWRGELSVRGGAIPGALLGSSGLLATHNLAQFGTIRHWTLRLTLVD